MTKILWQVYKNNNWVTMKTPSSFDLDGDDLDNNSYRSFSSGDINRTIIGKKWQSAKFEYNHLTEAEAEAICEVLDLNPMQAKFKSPAPTSTNGIWTGYCYCSKWHISMRQNKQTGAIWQNLTFTLVQGKKVSGQ